MDGIENREQLEFARDYGCDFVQGDLFTPPLPAKEMNAWFKDRPLVLW
jgi:EAL domain-containing protein (putative c-di-GMP-specific phosphodiesterase class I)